MYFASDNWAGASAPVMAAMTKANEGKVPAYGDDKQTQALEQRFKDLFETDCAVWIVATGTAANALSLSAITGPGGAVFCHKEAHIRVDECGAPEFLTSGARMWGLEGNEGKLTPDDIKQGLKEVPHNVVHHGQPNALSISQASEIGLVYTLEEIQTLGQTAKDNNLAFHMDGARFANALVALDVSPAEMTWKAGIDILSFGATKNGAWCAEAIIIFNKAYNQGFMYRRKQAGHLFSKMRFASAQFEGYLDNDHWLDNARHANAMTARLAKGIAAHAPCRLTFPVKANELFAILPDSSVKRLLEKGAHFHDWPANGLPEPMRPKEGETLVRLVCSFATTPQEVDTFIALL